MPHVDPKVDLHEYLQSGREVMLWKLDGLTEYDVRRPIVPTGTNLLGLVRHADILRELIDGAVGADRRWSNLPSGDEAWWTGYRNKVEAAALQAEQSHEFGR